MDIKANVEYTDEQKQADSNIHTDINFDMLGGQLDNEHERGNFTAKWPKSTAISPMPIKIELTPFSIVFEALGYKRHYHKALKCYAKSGKGKS